MPSSPRRLHDFRQENFQTVDALLLSFVVIFIAELGDKSQLMALTFAMRYKAITVLAAITAATAVVHAASVGLGAALSLTLPTRPISIVAGVAFFVFAAWTLRGDELTDEEKKKSNQIGKSVFFAVAGAFFLAELGDKTMLATITLATKEGLWGTWIGSTIGMVAADALAIAVGKVLHKHLPERTVKIGAAVLFAIFGVLLIAEGIFG